MLEMKQITLTIVLALLAIDYAGAAADVDAGDTHVVKLGQLIHDYRAQHDVPPLALDAPLSELAHEHATRMAQDKRLSHYGFEERFAKAGSPTDVEKVARKPGTAEGELTPE